MNIITAQTGNPYIDYTSMGTRFCAGYARAVYALWYVNSSVIASTACTVAATALLLSQNNTSPQRRATAPLVIGATTAVMLLSDTFVQTRSIISCLLN